MVSREPTTLEHQGFGPQEVDLRAYQQTNLTPAPAQPPTDGSLSVATFGGVVTAQRVAKPRDLGDVRNKIKVLAEMAGEKYYYRWTVKERKTGKTSTVQGLSIKGANDCAREWGNDQVDIRVADEGNYWTFYARFTDLETGYSLTRPFRQRKAADIGEGYDAERRLDQIFQIGASKAIRNVITNSLQTLADFAFESAMHSVHARVAGNPEGARSHLINAIKELGIEMTRVTRIYQRAPEEWTVPDMARLYAELNSIRDGMASVEDIFPREVTEVPAKEARRPASETSTKKTAPAKKSAPAPKTAPAKKEPTPGADEYPQRYGPGKFDWEDRDGIRYGEAVGDDGSFLFGWSKQQGMPSHQEGSFRAARGRQKEADEYRRRIISQRSQTATETPEPEPEPEPEGPEPELQGTGQVASPADDDAWQKQYDQQQAKQEGGKSLDDEWDLD